MYTSVPLTCCTIRVRHVFDVQLINFTRTWGEQRTPGAWKRHLAHPVLFVFAQNPTNFGLWQMVCEPFAWHSTGSQSRSHICAFGSRTIQRACVYKALGYHRCTCIIHPNSPLPPPPSKIQTVGWWRLATRLTIWAVSPTLFNVKSLSCTLLTRFEPLYTNIYHMGPTDGAVSHYILRLEIYGATSVRPNRACTKNVQNIFFKILLNY